MKKWLGLAILIIIALVLGGYYVTGFITEQTIKKDLNRMNQSSDLVVEPIEYKRGWFTSDLLMSWHLHVPEHIVTTPDGQNKTIAAQDYTIQRPLTIYHGPIIFNHGVKFGLGQATTELVLPSEYTQEFSRLFSSESIQPSLKIDLLVTYLNNTQLELSIPTFKLFSKQNDSEFNWLGLISKTTVSSSLNKISGNISLEGVHFLKEQLEAILSNVKTDYSLHKSKEGLFLGEANLSFPSFTIINNKQNRFELQQFEAHSDSDIKNGLFDSHFKASIDIAKVNDKVYGPGHLEVAVRNLDAAALTRINSLANEMHQGVNLGRQKAMLAMLPELPKLVSQGAEFELSSINLKMPEGTFDGNLVLSLPKDKEMNLFNVLQKLQGHGKLKMPTLVAKQMLAGWIKQKMESGQSPNQEAGLTTPTVDLTQADAQAENQLAFMVQAGTLSREENDYVLVFNLEQGQLTINGKLFNTGMLNSNNKE